MHLYIKHFVGNNVIIKDIDECDEIRQVYDIIEKRLNISSDKFRLTYKGKKLEHDNLLKDYSITHECNIDLSLYILGGKGGFGAMLRAKAKQKGQKATTDYGACRDLSGRRLRHVNDEIILQKWKESKEAGKDFDVDEDTPTGVKMWYLAKPAWADKVKFSGQQKFMKSRMKTVMCKEWQEARESSDPPENAPNWWGCPRGDKCRYGEYIPLYFR